MHLFGSPALMQRPPVLNGPTVRRIAHIVEATEEFGGWILGRLVEHPDVSVELGFEQWDKFLASDWTLLKTSIVYLRMDRGRERLFEHQFRQTITQPKYDYILKTVRDLVTLFRGYEPPMMPPRSYPRELSLQPMSQRQDLSDRQPRLNKRRNKKKARMRGLRR